MVALGLHAGTLSPKNSCCFFWYSLNFSGPPVRYGMLYITRDQIMVASESDHDN